MLLDKDLNFILNKLNKSSLTIACSSLDMCYLYNYKLSRYQTVIYTTSSGEIYIVNHHIQNGLCITDKNINTFNNFDIIISDNPLFTSKLIR